VQLGKLLAGLDEAKRKAFLDRLAQVIEEKYYSLGNPLATVRPPLPLLDHPRGALTSIRPPTHTLLLRFVLCRRPSSWWPTPKIASRHPYSNNHHVK
jgi:hypothetical protein